MALLEYLATEVVEDWTDGLISRPEALRRLVIPTYPGVDHAFFSDTGARCYSAQAAAACADAPEWRRDELGG